MAEQEGAAPPGGGRMNHDVMRLASERPVEGPAATDTLAASGGLEVPGGALEGQTPGQQADRADAERMPPPTLVSVEKVDRNEEEPDK